MDSDGDDGPHGYHGISVKAFTDEGDFKQRGILQ